MKREDTDTFSIIQDDESELLSGMNSDASMRAQAAMAMFNDAPWGDRSVLPYLHIFCATDTLVSDGVSDYFLVSGQSNNWTSGFKDDWGAYIHSALTDSEFFTQPTDQGLTPSPLLSNGVPGIEQTLIGQYRGDHNYLYTA